MNLIVVGTNHKYSPIKVREKISFSRKRLKDALNFLRYRSALCGAVILSTCNRVEIYASAKDSARGIREVEDFISRYHEIDKRETYPYFYRYANKNALEHLLSVACGLDSLILGETQILDQVKFSFFEAESAGFVDKILQETFYSCLSFAKRAHAQTKISEGKVSAASVAIDFIKQRLGSLEGKNFLIIGVGKITELVLKYLRKENPNVIFVSNRTFAKAYELAARIKAKAIRFDHLNQSLKAADVVISATASPHFIIKKETLQNVFNNEQGTTNNELLIIDLAMPRDVEPSVREIKGVELFCLEDLQTVIEKNRQKKLKETQRVKEIIEQDSERIWQKLTELVQEPALLP